MTPPLRPLALLALLAAGCAPVPPEESVRQIEVPAGPVLTRVDSVDVTNGGFGSGAAIDPADPALVYLVTDRGPNHEFGPDARRFPVPQFTPMVGVFRLGSARSRTLTLVRAFPLADSAGRPLSGLPRPPGPGSTGERAFGPDGAELAPDPLGLDTEGIHVLAGGAFWIADEYGPTLARFSADGRLARWLVPGTGPGDLPAVLARRRPNRGFEGLTGDPEGRVLAAIVQSPLDNPREAGRRSVHTRILLLEPATGTTRQYLYPLDTPELLAGDLAWLEGGDLLVIEHDGRLPGGDPPAAVKRIYRASLAGATDVSDAANRPAGLLAGGRTLEELSPADLAAAGIRPAAKTLVADLLALGYPHDKPEGLVVLDSVTIGVVNDDDFGLRDAPGGRVVAKRLPATGQPDRNVLWLVRIAPSLAGGVRPDSSP